MAEKLVQHRHCQMCLKAVPLGEEYCSEECKDKWDQLVKQNRKKNIVVWVWMMVAVIVLVFVMMLYQ